MFCIVLAVEMVLLNDKFRDFLKRGLPSGRLYYSKDDC